MQPFAYSTKKRRVIVRRHYQVPEDVLSDAEELRLWAGEAINFAGAGA